MCIPVAACLGLVKAAQFTRVMHASSKLVRQNHRMQHHVEMLLMQFVHYFFRIGKHSRIPHERAVLGVPAGWTKPGTQVDQSVTRQLFLSECFWHTEYFVTIRQCAV